MKLLTKKPHIFKIKDKKGQVVPFNLNLIQTIILEAIQKDLKEKGKARKLIIKGRQGGVTTLFQLLSLSYAMTQKAINCYTMAHDSQTATDIFEQKVKFAFDNLPPLFKNLYKVKRDNTRQLMFDGEMQKATLTVGTSARGTTQNILHISEAGKMSLKKQVWDEMMSGTLQASKQADIIVVESTADGGLGEFYEMVQKALRGESEFDVLFISWTLSPEYSQKPPKDDSWKEKYKSLATTYNLYQDPVKQFGISESQWYWYYLATQELKEEIKVQYPFTLDEAFVTKARNKFDVNIVKNLKTQTPIKEHQSIKFFRAWDQGQTYSIGIDGSTGLGNDFTGITIRGLRKINGKYPLYAQLKAKVQTKETAFIVINMYNEIIASKGRAYIIPERNSIGESIINYLRDYIDENYIYSEMTKPSTELDKPVRKFGYATTSANRSGSDPYLVDKMANLFHEDELEVVNEDEMQEMLKFIWNDDKRRYEAQAGFHDDLLLSDMLCCQGFDYILKEG